MISDLAAGKVDVLSNFDAYYLSLALEATPQASTSQFLGTAPADVFSTLTGAAGQNVTTNWHHYGVSPSTFSASVAPAGFVATSTNVDREGLPFVSTMEHETLPVSSV